MTKRPGETCKRPGGKPGRRLKELSEADQELAIRMLRAGVFKRDVAAAFGMSPETLRRILSRDPAWTASCSSSCILGTDTKQHKHGASGHVKTFSIN